MNCQLYIPKELHPHKNDTIVLVTPPATVVELEILLHASPVYTVPLHVKRLANWLQSQCKHFHHIDCAADPERKLWKIGTMHAGPNSQIPKERNVYSCSIGINKLQKRLLSVPSPTQIWVTSFFAYDRNRLQETISAIKRTLPNVPVVVGGAYASICPEDCLSMGADVVHSGLYHPAEHSDATFIKNAGLIVATRGCPNNCTYCAFGKIEGNKPKTPNPSSIIEQAKQLESAGVTTIAYYAPAIFKKRFSKTDEVIMEGLANIHCDMVGWAGFDPSALTAQRAKLLRNAGFIDLTVPIQTLDRKITQKWHRQDTLQEHNLAIEYLQDAGFSKLEIGCDIIMGSPDQTLEEIIRSMCWVWSKGLTPTVFPYTWVPKSIDAKRLGFEIQDIHPEQYQPYLFPFADPNHTGNDYIELVKLSRILPNTLTTALKYIDPKSAVKKMIDNCLNDLEFGVTQWELDIDLPELKQGYNSFLSHPWELALEYNRQNTLLPEWLKSACRSVRTREKKYNSVRCNL